jgi:hypothetical protein
MNITSKQKKTAWIIAAVLVVIHYANPLIMTIRQRIGSMTSAPAVPSKPSPAHPFPPPAVGQGEPAALVTDPSRYIGVWAGSELLPDRDVCRVRLEVRKDEQKPGQFTGYLSRACGSTAPVISMKDIGKVIQDSTPINGILSGPMVNGTIQLHLDKAIGEPADRCELTDSSATLFGEQLSVEWKQGTHCPAGTMMLKKERI